MNIKEDYVKFFIQRNHLYQYDHFEEIANNILNDPRIASIITELQDWPCYEIKSHKNAAHPLHKLSFLAELGFNRDDPQIGNIIKRILEHQSEEGSFHVLINIPKHFGGTGEPIMSWVLCDAPLLLYPLIKLNKNEITSKIRKGVDHIAEIVSENGWHCLADKKLGKFRGPGRKEDPCPYATMLSLKMLSTTHENEYENEKKIGIQTLFHLWDSRKETKPYLFGMGTDFKKLKLPFVWYDILNIVDTLSVYSQAIKDKRFIEMMQIIKGKETEDGYIPESIYLKSRQWDFGQKKQPSEFMNAIVYRIENRLK